MKRILMAFLLAVCAGGAAFAGSGGSCVVKNGQGSAAYVNFDCQTVYVGLDYETANDVVVLVEVTYENGNSEIFSLTIPASTKEAQKLTGQGSGNCVVSAKIASASCL